ncbi:hypothetical protein KAURM247S_06050 [Kitasatospora aureofaciens]
MLSCASAQVGAPRSWEKNRIPVGETLACTP